MRLKMMAKTMTAVCLKCSCAQQRTVQLESYLKVHSRTRDHSCTQTKFHVDPCRDSRDYPVTKMQTDERTYIQTDLQLYLVDS